MAKRGITVSYETVRDWCLKFGGTYAKRVRSRSLRPGDRWHLDEVFLRIAGQLQYPWRAIDRDGEVLERMRAELRHWAEVIRISGAVAE